MKEYEITEETLIRPNGERYILQQILEKGTCRIVGRRIVELDESEQKRRENKELRWKLLLENADLPAQLKELLRRAKLE